MFGALRRVSGAPAPRSLRRAAIIDDLLERHVTDELERALVARGIAVRRSGKVAHGSGPVADPVAAARLARAVDATIEFGPDLALLMRPQNLPIAQLRRLRRAGITVAAWLSDGPVLLATGCAPLLDEADLVLVSGDVATVQYLDDRAGRPVVQMPFWCAASNAASSPAAPDERGIFYGNLHDGARRGRVELLAGLEPAPLVFGRVQPGDRRRLRWAGGIDELDVARAAFRRARIGLSVSQRYADYAGSPFDFPALGRLGGFALPSRIVQYAAAGLPVLSLGSGAAVQLRGVLETGTAAEFTQAYRELDADELGERAARILEDHRAHFTGDSRVDLLVGLFEDDGWRSLDAAARTTLFRTVAPRQRPQRRGGPRPASGAASAGRPLEGEPIALFGSGWQSETSELGAARRELGAAGASIRELNPFALSSELLPDPDEDFEGLLDAGQSVTSLLADARALVVVGARYGLTARLWRLAEQRGMPVVVVADESGPLSRRRAKLASRAHAATFVRPDAAEAAELGEGPSRGLAALAAAPPIPRPQGGRAQSRRVAPGISDAALAEALAEAKGGTIVMEPEFAEAPARARAAMRAVAASGACLLAPRRLMELLRALPSGGMRLYDDDEERDVHLLALADIEVGAGFRADPRSTKTVPQAVMAAQTDLLTRPTNSRTA